MKLRPTREGYAEGLIAAGEINGKVVVLDADVSRSIGSFKFGEKFPDRYFNIGISEQDMLGEAAGLALAGYIPFVSTYGVFATGRAWDQIRTTVCYMNLDVKIGGAHTGVSVGPDGATHQAFEDTAIMRVLPRMKILAPADVFQTRAAVLAAMKTTGPVYIRFGRNPVPVIYTETCKVESGKGDLLADGGDVTIVASGMMVSEALEALKLLSKKGIKAGLINMVSIKPLDEELLLSQAKRTSVVIVAEDHQQIGGLYGAVSEYLGKTGTVTLRSIGIPDSFGFSATPEEIQKHFGLTAENIAQTAQNLLSGK